MSFTITLQSVSNFLSTHADLLPLTGVGGYLNEPYLTLVNDTLSSLLTVDYNWKINRFELPMLVTAPNKQDYLFAGACVFSLGGSAQGWAIDLSSNSAITVAAGIVTVRTLENHRFVIGDVIYLTGVVATTGTTSAYNSVFTDTGSASSWSNGWTITAITANTFTFAATAGQNNADVAGAPGITNFGTLTDGSMVKMTDGSSPQYSQNILTFRDQPVSSRIGDPERVAVIADAGAGIIKVRFFLCPGSTIWGAKLVQQAQAPVKQSLADTFFPLPDHYSAMYRQALIYRMYRYLNHPQQNAEYMKLQQEIAKLQAADDSEECSIYIQPEESLMSGPGSGSWYLSW